MKTPNLHLLTAMILPAALLLSQCSTTDGTTPRTATAVPASSQHCPLTHNKLENTL